MGELFAILMFFWGLGLVVLVLVIASRRRPSPDHNPSPIATGHHAKPAAQVGKVLPMSTPTTDSSCGGLGVSQQPPRSVRPCLAQKIQNSYSANPTVQANYYDRHEAEMQAQYAHASSTYADPYTEPEPAQAEPPATPSRWGEGYDTWREQPRLGDGKPAQDAPRLGEDTSEYIEGEYRELSEQELSRL